MPTHPVRTVLLLTLALSGVAQGQIRAPETRGALLYNTHCLACHSAQLHWRNNRIARDWNGLLVQVRRWQAVERLGWSDADIAEVARYLNDTIYRYAPTTLSQRE